jgi:hypothetical protein
MQGRPNKLLHAICEDARRFTVLAVPHRARNNFLFDGAITSMVRYPNLHVLIVLGVLPLVGCGSVPSLNDVDPNNLQPTQAMLLFSAGASSPCKVNSAQMVLKSSTAPAALLRGEAVFQLNNAYIASAFPGEYANVLSIVVAPGTYDFWVSSVNPFLHYPDPVFSKPFAVESKEVVYIGEVFTQGCGGDVRIEIRDRSTRDIEYLQSKYPKARESRPKTRLLQMKPQSHGASVTLKEAGDASKAQLLN